MKDVENILKRITSAGFYVNSKISNLNISQKKAKTTKKTSKKKAVEPESAELSDPLESL